MIYVKKKSLIVLLMTLAFLFVAPKAVFAQEKVKVYLFRSDTCPICQQAVAFFNELASDEEYKDMFELVDFEVSSSKNAKLMDEVSEAMGDGEVNGVPYIVIGDRSFGGYTSSWDEDIKAEIKETYEDESFVDPLKDIVGETDDSNDTFIIVGVLVVAVVLVGGVIFFARKGSPSSDEEQEETVLVEEKKEEVKEEIKEEIKDEEVKVKSSSSPKKKTVSKTSSKKATGTKSTTKKTQKRK